MCGPLQVPVSKDEKDNGVVHEWGTKRPSEEGLYHHHELLWMIDGYEPEVRESGCGGVGVGWSGAPCPGPFSATT